MDARFRELRLPCCKAAFDTVDANQGFPDAQANKVYLVSVPSRQNGCFSPGIAGSHLQGYCHYVAQGQVIPAEKASDCLMLLVDEATMEWVEAREGISPGEFHPVVGGWTEDGKLLHHALCDIQGVQVPGQSAAHLGGAQFPLGSGVFFTRSNYKVLCFRQLGMIATYHCGVPLLSAIDSYLAIKLNDAGYGKKVLDYHTSVTSFMQDCSLYFLSDFNAEVQHVRSLYLAAHNAMSSESSPGNASHRDIASALQEMEQICHTWTGPLSQFVKLQGRATELLQQARTLHDDSTLALRTTAYNHVTTEIYSARHIKDARSSRIWGGVCAGLAVAAGALVTVVAAPIVLPTAAVAATAASVGCFASANSSDKQAEEARIGGATAKDGVVNLVGLIAALTRFRQALAGVNTQIEFLHRAAANCTTKLNNRADFMGRISYSQETCDVQVLDAALKGVERTLVTVSSILTGKETIQQRISS